MSSSRALLEALQQLPLQALPRCAHSDHSHCSHSRPAALRETVDAVFAGGADAEMERVRDAVPADAVGRRGPGS